MPPINLFNQSAYFMIEACGLNAVFRRFHRGEIKVLVYHNTPDAEDFKRQIDYLKKHYNIVKLDAQGRWHGLSQDRVNVLLTFDDGFESNYRVAFPILREMGLSGCFFMISTCVKDGSAPAFAKKYWAQADGDLYRRTIDAAQAKEMLAGGMVLGSHSQSHQDFATLGLKEGVADAVQSREDLAAMLGAQSALFAFPFGHYKPDQLSALKAEFRRIMTTEHGFNLPNDAALSRNEVSGRHHMYAGASGALDAVRRLGLRPEESGLTPPLLDTGYRFEARSCNICGGDDTVYMGRRAPRSFKIPQSLQAKVVRCKTCGLIYPNPMPIAKRGQLEANYGDPAEYFPHPLCPAIDKISEGFLDRLDQLGAKGRLLDVGCGRGEFLGAAKRRGWEVQGVEISPSFARFAREKFGIETLCGLLPDLKLPGESFDAITLLSVLQHTYDPKAMLEEIRRLLKPGGVLILETMNNAGLLYQLGDVYYKLAGKDLTINLSPTFPSYQVYGFSPKPMKAILERTGFTDISIELQGGVSSRLTLGSRGLFDRILLTLAQAAMLAAKWLNRGQVLIAIARKRQGRLK